MAILAIFGGFGDFSRFLTKLKTLSQKWPLFKKVVKMIIFDHFWNARAKPPSASHLKV